MATATTPPDSGRPSANWACSAAGGSRERDASTRDFVGPVDDLGWPTRSRRRAGARHGFLAIDVDQRFGGGSASGGAVGGNGGADSDRNRGVERDRRAAALDGTAGRYDACPGHSGDARFSRSRVSLHRRLLRIEVAGREDQYETGVAPESFDRFLDGVEGRTDLGSGACAGETVSRSDEVGRGHRQHLPLSTRPSGEFLLSRRATNHSF